MEPQKKLAVKVQHGYKSFKTGERVLNNISISVKQGSIYAILGASGCGKTTLLSCILSLQSLDSGSISVFGKNPGSKECGIPGTLAGYMPQEYALYEILKISDILWFYGNLYGMKKKEINSRISFLKTFLQLPKLSRVVNTLSGGQCRRVSLAVAMIHQPKLLILDEPSVGLDPILRESIWNHLRKLVKQENVTVIVTSHYTTESLNCDKVGIMRNGRLIAEDCPRILQKQFEEDQTFDEIVMMLCKMDESDRTQLSVNSEEAKIEKDSDEEKFESYKKLSEGMEFLDEDGEISVKHPRRGQMILALGYKNLLAMWRVPIVVAILLITPSLNSLVLEATVGGEPKGLILNAVIANGNQSTGNFCHGFNPKSNLSCFGNERFTICNYLQKLESRHLKLTQVTNEHEALENVEMGQAIGYLVFGENYSQHLQNRMIFGNWANKENILGAEVKIRMDMTNSINSMKVQTAILEEYQNSMKDIVLGCGEDERLVEYPLKINSLHGKDSASIDGYIAFIRPCVLVLIMFIMGTTTGAIYCAEKNKGVKSRNYVAGVNFSNQLISSLITDSMTLLLQALSLLFLLSFVYRAEFKGSMTLCLLIAYLSAISGMMISIFASELVDNELQVTEFVMFVLIMQLNNMFWPLECIPWFWRILCFGMPLTFPLDGIRCVMFYGWGISHWRVIRALGMSLIWIFGIGLLTLIIRGKKR